MKASMFRYLAGTTPFVQRRVLALSSAPCRRGIRGRGAAVSEAVRAATGHCVWLTTVAPRATVSVYNDGPGLARQEDAQRPIGTAGIIRRLTTAESVEVPSPPSSNHPYKTLPDAKGRIIYTETDEAPALATYALYPIVSKVWNREGLPVRRASFGGSRSRLSALDTRAHSHTVLCHLCNALQRFLLSYTQPYLSFFYRPVPNTVPP